MNLVTWTKVHFLEEIKYKIHLKASGRLFMWSAKKYCFTEVQLDKMAFCTVLTYSFEDPLFIIEKHEKGHNKT